MRYTIDELELIVKAMKARAPRVRDAWETARVAQSSMRSILRNLLRARKDSGLPPATIARSMAVPSSAVARLESGRHNPTLKTLARYAAAVGAVIVVQPPRKVPPDWFKPRAEDLNPGRATRRTPRRRR